MIFIAPRLCLLVPRANSPLPDTKTSDTVISILYPAVSYFYFWSLVWKQKKKEKDVAGQKFSILWVSLQICVQTLVGSCTSWSCCSLVACLLWQKNCNLQFTNPLSKWLYFVLIFNGLVRRTLFQSMAEFLDSYCVEYSRWDFQIFWLFRV